MRGAPLGEIFVDVKALVKRQLWGSGVRISNVTHGWRFGPVTSHFPTWRRLTTPHIACKQAAYCCEIAEPYSTEVVSENVTCVCVCALPGGLLPAVRGGLPRSRPLAAALRGRAAAGEHQEAAAVAVRAAGGVGLRYPEHRWGSVSVDSGVFARLKQAAS